MGIFSGNCEDIRFYTTCFLPPVSTSIWGPQKNENPHMRDPHLLSTISLNC